MPCASHYALAPIGLIEGCYPDKFGVPRQPGLARAATARLRLLGEFAQPDAVRGIDAFSHLWLTFVFHLSPPRWTPLVRPPRLGGNRKTGVFASRATHRPNRLGLSLVELMGVELDDGVCLVLRGHDLVDGTPVVDIKPYLPWADGAEHARAGFAPCPPELLPVRFCAEVEAQLASRADGASLRALIEDVLAQDPRPAYHPIDPARRYGVRLADLDVGFRLSATENGPQVEVIDLRAWKRP